MVAIRIRASGWAGRSKRHISNARPWGNLHWSHRPRLPCPLASSPPPDRIPEEQGDRRCGSWIWELVEHWCGSRRLQLRNLRETSTSVVRLLGPLCVAGVYFVIVVELQLQRLRYGTWRFRYSLRSVLLLTAIAAAFFAVASYGFREQQREFVFNAELKKDLETVIQGGTVSISNPGGRGILCQVTRSNFSDDDLAKVIELASSGSTHTCELEDLLLGATSITNAGICQLADCRKLVVVELPPIDLSAAAIDSLSKCRRLEIVVIDERRLNAEHLTHLRDALPHIMLNGKTWAQRDQH